MSTLIEGEGTPLILLHGYGSRKEYFIRQISYLSRYFKVYAPDFPGVNGPLPYAFSLEDYSKAFKGFLDELGCDKCYVLCHSFGARVLLKSLPDERIKKIIFTGAAGLKPRRGIKYFLKIWAYKSIKAIFGQKLAKKVAKKTCSTEYNTLTPVARESFNKIVNEHLDGKLSYLTAPTLIIHGTKDRETPPYMARRLLKGAKNGALVFLDGGHFLFVDQPQKFNLIAKEFLLS